MDPAFLTSGILYLDGKIGSVWNSAAFLCCLAVGGSPVPVTRQKPWVENKQTFCVCGYIHSFVGKKLRRKVFSQLAVSLTITVCRVWLDSIPELQHVDVKTKIQLENICLQYNILQIWTFPFPLTKYALHPYLWFICGTHFWYLEWLYL